MMTHSFAKLQTVAGFRSCFFRCLRVSSGVALATTVGIWSSVASADSRVEGSAGALVDSSAESLLALEGSVLPSDLSYEGVRDFLTCFVGHMDLPPQVYIDCGVSVARASVQCRGQGLGDQCLSSLVVVAQKCAAPVSQAIQGVQQCLVASEEDAELHLHSEW